MLFFFFFNDTATTEIYTLSLHDALPISRRCGQRLEEVLLGIGPETRVWNARNDGRGLIISGKIRPGRSLGLLGGDRKSTRLNSSHQIISYAVFCLKKKKKNSPIKTPKQN